MPVEPAVNAGAANAAPAPAALASDAPAPAAPAAKSAAASPAPVDRPVPTRPPLAAGEITEWLAGLNGTLDPGAGEQLFTLLYDELHRIARKHMFREQPNHTLCATALTHEAWFRMSEQNRTRWRGRAHFLAVSSTMMRRILVNHAMAKQADKREAARVSLTLTEAAEIGTATTPPDVVAVHDALLAFEAVDARAAQVVELKFFGGLENEEIAEALGISLATVKRDWVLARAWLHRELAH